MIAISTHACAIVEALRLGKRTLAGVVQEAGGPLGAAALAAIVASAHDPSIGLDGRLVASARAALGRLAATRREAA